jgi:MFS family permease
MSTSSALLRDPRVRRWTFATGVSLVGDQMWTVALAWTAVRLGGAGLAGIVMATSALPRAGLMLVGGALADRISLRRLMLSCDVARTLVLVAALLVLEADGPSPVLLILVSLCFGLADAAYTPAAASFPVQMVTGDELIALSGLRQLILRGAVLAGAPLGGVLVATGGFQAAVLADAVSFAVIAVVLVTLRPRFDRPLSDGTTMLGDLRAGLHYVRSTPDVRRIVVALSGLNVFVTPVIAIGLAQLASGSGWGSSRLGILTGLIGAGAAVGTVAAMRWRPRQTVRAGLLVLVPQAAALACLGVAPFPVAVVAMSVVGITAGLASPLLSGAFQQTVDWRYLGRCNSLVAVADAGLTPLALVLFGWAAGAVGLAVTCAAFGAGFAGLVLNSARRPQDARSPRHAAAAPTA